MQEGLHPIKTIMKQRFEDWRIFTAVVVVAALPSVYVAYGARAQVLFALGLLSWSLMPLAIGYGIFLLRRQLAAWGWIVLVAVHNNFVFLNVRQSESSTASLDYVTAPLLNAVIIGPLGALVGVFLVRVIRRPKRSH